MVQQYNMYNILMCVLCNLKCESGPTTLFGASYNGSIDVCIALLKTNANLNEKLEDGATVLFQATQEGYAGVCAVLLEHDANVNKKIRKIAQRLSSKQHSMVML